MQGTSADIRPSRPVPAFRLFHQICEGSFCRPEGGKNYELRGGHRRFTLPDQDNGNEHG